MKFFNILIYSKNLLKGQTFWLHSLKASTDLIGSVGSSPYHHPQQNNTLNRRLHPQMSNLKWTQQQKWFSLTKTNDETDNKNVLSHKTNDETNNKNVLSQKTNDETADA